MLSPERGTGTWLVGLVIVFVLIGLAMCVEAVRDGVARLVARVWRGAVAVIVAGVWLGLIAAAAGPAVATSTIVGAWLISLSVTALTWWSVTRVTSSAGWQRWRLRRRPIHQQPELLERMERLQS